MVFEDARYDIQACMRNVEENLDTGNLPLPRPVFFFLAIDLSMDSKKNSRLAQF